LLGHTAGRQIEQVEALEFQFSGSSEELPNSQGSVTRFVDAGIFAGSRGDATVFVYMLEVIAKQRAGKVQALFGKVVHIKPKGIFNANRLKCLEWEGLSMCYEV
jgi:hypothetical protein